MNIALLIDGLDGGGSEGVVARLALGLTQREHRISVYCLKEAGAPLRTLTDAGVNVREARSVGRDPRLFFRLKDWLVADDIQLVHAHSCAALVSVFPAARWLGLPLVHVRHGRPSHGRNRYVWLADRLSSWIDALVINCNALRSSLPPGPVAQRAIHIPNGLDITPTAPDDARRALEQHCGRPLGRPIVLCVANLRPEKDILNLLRAVARLRQTFASATLVCVGAARDFSYQAAIKAECERLRLCDATFFPGPAQSAAQLMPAADVLCLSSRNDALPNVILEAMAQRVPIVATAVGDVGALNHASLQCDAATYMLEHGRTALLAPAGDDRALADALRETLDDRVAAAARAQAAQVEHAQRFTAARMLDRYEQLYAQLRAAKPVEQRARRRPAVLMVGPASPQVGGMVTSIDTLMSSPLASEFSLHRFATIAPRKSGAAPGTRSLTACLRSAAHGLVAAPRHLLGLASLGYAIARRRIDVVHIHTCSFASFYRSAADFCVARLLRRRVVVHIRGGQFERFCRTRSAFGRRLIRLVAEHADRVVLLGESIAQQLRPFLGSARVSVVPNGVAIAARPDATREISARPCRFLFLGELSDAKGLPELLHAAAAMNDAAQPFELLIAGPVASGSADARYRRLVDDGKLTRHITFLGPVDRARRAQLLQSVDCLVHPSRGEAMPNTILEAGASGLAVIATAVGCVPEMLEAKTLPQRNAVCWDAICPLVQPCDSIGLASAMMRIASDPQRRIQIGAALRERVSVAYSDARLAERMTEVYRAVLAQSGARLPRAAHTRPSAALVSPVSSAGDWR